MKKAIAWYKKFISEALKNEYVAKEFTNLYYAGYCSSNHLDIGLNEVARLFPNEKIHVNHGSYRFCIINERFDYILKFDWDFECGDSGCDDEIIIYDQIKDHFGSDACEFFAKIISIGTVGEGKAHSPELYICERADINEDKATVYWDNDQEEALHKVYSSKEYANIYKDDVFEFSDRLNRIFCGDRTFECFLDYYIDDISKFLLLIDVLTFIGSKDIHDRNIGFVDGKPVIIDYAM